MSKASELVCRARELAQTTTTWADLSNALFDPIEGLLAGVFPTREERKQFTQTVEFREIQQILADSVERFGLIEGATPTKITGFMVQLHWTSDHDATSDTSFRVTTSADLPAPSSSFK